MDILLKDTGNGGEIVLQEGVVLQDFPPQLEVTGAGTSVVNGCYLYAGVSEGGYSMYDSPSVSLSAIYMFPPVRWYMTVKGYTPISVYVAESDSLTPPKTGWVPISGGQQPAPEINHQRDNYATTNADIYPDTGIGTAVYTSLFTSTNWSDLLKSEEEIVRGAGDFEAQLSEPITAGSVATLQQKALIQLSWLKSTGAVSELSVRVSNPAVAVIQVDIYTTEPNDAKNRYKMLWNKQEQKLISIKRNQL